MPVHLKGSTWFPVLPPSTCPWTPFGAFPPSRRPSAAASAPPPVPGPCPATSRPSCSCDGSAMTPPSRPWPGTTISPAPPATATSTRASRSWPTRPPTCTKSSNTPAPRPPGRSCRTASSSPVIAARRKAPTARRTSGTAATGTATATTSSSSPTPAENPCGCPMSSPDRPRTSPPPACTCSLFCTRPRPRSWWCSPIPDTTGREPVCTPPLKRPPEVDEERWDVDDRARNLLLRGLRCIGERTMAVLVGRWRVLRHTTMSPCKIGMIVQAALALTTIEKQTR